MVEREEAGGAQVRRRAGMQEGARRASEGVALIWKRREWE
jgi:hypothetical protein